MYYICVIVKKMIVKILHRIRNLRTGFKIILGYIILNLMVLIFLYNEYGQSDWVRLTLGNFLGGDITFRFGYDTFWFGILLILIYWFLWGHKRKDFK